MKNIALLTLLLVLFRLTNVMAYEPLPCNSNSDEAAVVKSIQSALVFLKQIVKSVPPEEAKYITDEMTFSANNDERFFTATNRPLFPALGIRNSIDRTEKDLDAVTAQQIASQHILALIDLRDELQLLYHNVYDNMLYKNMSAFYGGKDAFSNNTNNMELIVIQFSPTSLRQCIGFYLTQQKPIATH